MKIINPKLTSCKINFYEEQTNPLIDGALHIELKIETSDYKIKLT